MIDALTAWEGVLDPVDVWFARSVCRRAGVSHPDTLLAAALASRAPAHGHTRVTLANVGLGPDAPPLPDPVAWRATLLASPSLVREVGSPGVTPLVVRGGTVALDRWVDLEDRLAAAILARLEPRPGPERNGRLMPGIAEGSQTQSGPAPDDPAERAVAVVQACRLALVTGGPGTGKTTLVRRVLAALDQGAADRGDRAPRVLLLAPTGKAAARMREQLGRQASTLHAALGFGRAPVRSLRADVVIVDEASMVDLAVMTWLVEAVPPDAKLVLLGDPDQLASVDAGAVLADLVCTTTAAHHVELTRAWRFDAGSGIGRLASAVREGRVNDALEALSSSPDITWVAEPPADARARRLLWGHLLRDGYAPLQAAAVPAEAVRALGAFRVLCAHREGPFGVAEVHDAARDVFGALRGRPRLPWLVTANDRRLRIANGDTGVSWVVDGSLRLCLPDGRTLGPASIAGLDVAYASTVHKGQGSEHDHVVVALPPEGSPLATRELFYTAITRARRSLVVVGSAAVVTAAITTPRLRDTGLRERLS